MNYSTAIFLINKQARGIRCSYGEDLDPQGKPLAGDISLYKTLDPNIKVGDFAIVQTGTRWGMTVVRVEEIDVEPDFDSTSEIKWIVGTVDTAAAERLKSLEDQAITAIKRAEKRKRRDELAASLRKDLDEEIHELEAFDEGGAALEPPATPPSR